MKGCSKVISYCGYKRDTAPGGAAAVSARHQGHQFSAYPLDSAGPLGAKA